MNIKLGSPREHFVGINEIEAEVLRPLGLVLAHPRQRTAVGDAVTSQV
jgi:hypothetical protein